MVHVQGKNCQMQVCYVHMFLTYRKHVMNLLLQTQSCLPYKLDPGQCLMRCSNTLEAISLQLDIFFIINLIVGGFDLVFP